jgi:hypothetical protein
MLMGSHSALLGEFGAILAWILHGSWKLGDSIALGENFHM